MARQLYEIWEPKDGLKVYNFAVQLHNYVAYFETREKAETFVRAVKINRGEIKP
jgi:hypothetical protein